MKVIFTLENMPVSNEEKQKFIELKDFVPIDKDLNTVELSNQKIEIYDILEQLHRPKSDLNNNFYSKEDEQKVFLIYLAATYSGFFEKVVLSANKARRNRRKKNFVTNLFQMKYEIARFNIETISEAYEKLGFAIDFEAAGNFLNFLKIHSKEGEALDEHIRVGLEGTLKGNSDIKWTQERLEFLKRLWFQGLSISKIGVALGVPRNAVAGKAHRLGLPKRTPPIKIKKLYKDIPPETLLELCRFVFKGAIVSSPSRARSEIINKNSSIICATLKMLDDNKQFRTQLINSYLANNKSWLAFKATYPDLLLPLLLPANPKKGVVSEWRDFVKDATELFDSKIKFYVSLNQTETPENEKADKAVKIDENNEMSPSEFQQNASLWLEGLERKEVKRVYTRFSDLSEALSENKNEKQSQNSENATSVIHVNESYKDVLDSSINPAKQKSLDYLFQAHEKITSSIEKNTQNKRYQTVEVRNEQSKFRKSVLEAYQHKCCISGYGVEPALHAAHIQDYSVSRDSSLGNGICLRADIHILFDRGLVKIKPSFEIEISDELEFSDYWKYNGNKISLPSSQIDWPKKQNLNWKIAHFEQSISND